MQHRNTLVENVSVFCPTPIIGSTETFIYAQHSMKSSSGEKLACRFFKANAAMKQQVIDASQHKKWMNMAQMYFKNGEKEKGLTLLALSRQPTDIFRIFLAT
jgi:hypothetical protein